MLDYVYTRGSEDMYLCLFLWANKLEGHTEKIQQQWGGEADRRLLFMPFGGGGRANCEMMLLIRN